MGQKDGEKWTAAVTSQPTLPKSDRLLDSGNLPPHRIDSWSSSRLKKWGASIGSATAIQDFVCDPALNHAHLNNLQLETRIKVSSY